MRIICIAAFVFCGFTAARGEEVVHGQDHFQFIYRATIPPIDGYALLWIPLATSDHFQTVALQETTLPNGWRKIEDSEFHDQIALVDLNPAESAQAIELKYDVVRQEKESYSSASSEQRFLRPERLVPSNETFAALAREATKGKRPNWREVAPSTITCWAG